MADCSKEKGWLLPLQLFQLIEKKPNLKFCLFYVLNHQNSRLGPEECSREKESKDKKSLQANNCS